MPPKRRRRFQGLYYHSSPPKVLPMNDQLSSQNGRRRRDVDDFSIKLSTIRIWMHEKEIGKLTRVLWAGQGNRLRQQASTNPRVKRFLAAVPYVMNDIKEVHQAVIDNNLETLIAKLEPPVPQALITGKDANGLNVIHKASGLGHTKILEHLISIWPEGVNEVDITGKTPLHWAASAKNNMRCYTILTQAGCDEEAVDYKSKTPTYYRHKPQEIERAFLVYVPDAPRVSPDIATDWDALNDDNSSETKKSEIAMPLTNGLNGRSIDDSIENTSEVDLNDGLSTNDDDETNNNGNSKEPEKNGIENGPANSADNFENGDDENEKTNEENDEDENNANTVDNDKAVSDIQNGGELSTTSEMQENGENKENAAEAKENAEKENIEMEKNGNETDNEDLAVEELTPDSERNNDKAGNEGQNEEIKADDKEIVEVKEVDEEKVEEKALENESNIEESKHEDKIDNEPEITDREQAQVDDLQLEEPALAIAAAATAEDNETEKTEADNAINVLVDDNDEVNVEENEENTEAAANNNQAAEEANEKPAYLMNEYEKQKANKVLRQDQETGERICEVKSDKENDSSDKVAAQKQNGDNDLNGNENVADAEKNDDGEGDVVDNEEDDDEDVVGANSASQRTAAENPNSDDEAADDDEDVDQGVLNGSIEQLEDNQNLASPTSSLAIEGFVQGESEDNTVQSQSAANFVDEESRIQHIISSGDMEQLAQIVLNGDGSKLLDMQSKETDIQAFLNNVPNYMSKIRRVHEAARDGSLLSLQQALDRRKFAIAKDEISPNGATPLHVAVLFGHSDIVRYLAARFPETTTITDNDGRTALHYAAVIKDNGHFYNMLIQLGANSKTKDKLGNTPEFYNDFETNSNEILTYRQLLSNFGAEDLEAELLSDQGEAESQSFQSNPIFKTEQGKYLADTLAEPLIEALTEIANKRPDDPVSYLTNYLQSYLRTKSTSKIDGGSGSSKTNSTALANSNTTAGSRRMNGNVRNGTVTGADDIEIDETDETATPLADDRDEHGQSMLHFACARSHRRGGLMNLIEESNIDITYRDELYRTARDVSLQANQPANAKEIDRYVLSLAVVGDLRPFEHFAKSGYDHIVDVTDDSEKNILDIANERGHEKLAEFLSSLRSLEELREELHQMIRDNNVARTKEILTSKDGKWAISAKNYYGRTALHVAVLKESEELVEHFVEQFPDVLKIGDNLERSPLHYAMGTNAVESLSRILINKGAKRTAKDLKGRQPSYYFMNKADILRLQEEEDENR